MLPVIKQKGVVGFSLGVLFFLLTLFPAGSILRRGYNRGAVWNRV